MVRRILVTVTLGISLARALPYNGAGAANYAGNWQDWKTNKHDGFGNYFASGGNCCKFVSRCMTNKSGGGLKFWESFGDTLFNRIPRPRVQQ
jgi:hypothetical protein